MFCEPGMYLDRFKLIRKPFGINSDPGFLWLGDCHTKALASINRAVEGGGVIVLTGDVGTGKTTLLNTIVQWLPANIRMARIVDPCLELHLLFSIIAMDLGFELQSEERFDTAFIRFLETLRPLKEHCLVIVDEAQRISSRFLKILFSWQEISNGSFPVTVLLVGQNEFSDLLSSFQSGCFLEKIILNQVLIPLDRKETADYISYRMAISGAEEKIFLETALEMVFLFSRGYPREINIICDLCLVVAHGKESHVVDAALVESVARKLMLTRESFFPFSSPYPAMDKIDKVASHRKTVFAIALLLALLLAFVVSTPIFDTHIKDRIVSPQVHPDHPVNSNFSLELLPVQDPHESLDTLVRDAFKPVERRISDLPGGKKQSFPENNVKSSTPVENHRSHIAEDSGSDDPDSGDLIIWLLEKKGFSN